MTTYEQLKLGAQKLCPWVPTRLIRSRVGASLTSFETEALSLVNDLYRSVLLEGILLRSGAPV